jgi:hypothetical protein
MSSRTSASVLSVMTVGMTSDRGNARDQFRRGNGSAAGAGRVCHGRYVAFQMAEVAIPRQMFQEILRLIAELRPQPPPAPA